ncbi:MAG TPA: hypothetical protein VLZ82_03215 [Microbacterium sp.]|nr:hypothetical protein [Microbacterium sp.]
MESSRWPDGTCFAEVLAREEALLAAAHDPGALRTWRTHLVAEVTDPESPYASALGRAGCGDSDRAGFLEAWKRLIAAALERIAGQQASDDGSTGRCGTAGRRIDADRTAVLVLAAVHGGVVLSRLSSHGRPIDAALDLALAPVLHADRGLDRSVRK